MDRMAIRTIARSRALRRPTPPTQLFYGPRTLSTVLRVADISFWKSLIPRPLRRENRQVHDPLAPKKSWRSKQWNPATFFIVIFLLIGSMSIQMISLRRNFEAFMRRSEVRIGLLREVVERIQNGEDVDVDQVLGSGDLEREAAWEEVLNEIEKDSPAKSQKKQEKAKPQDSLPSTAKAVSDTEPKSDALSIQEPSKGRTAYFF